MPTIEVLCGMIASGKSTYARRRADEGALVVSHDDLTQMLHARYRYEQELREPYRRMEEAIVSEIWRAGRDVVVDRTHLTRESRRRWIDHADWIGAGASLVAVAFPIEPPAIHARRRTLHDPRGRPHDEWLRVAEHHHDQAQAEPLDIAEGFAEIRRIGRDDGDGGDA
jgi:predicted kinase